jgi:hypothetical protein
METFVLGGVLPLRKFLSAKFVLNTKIGRTYPTTGTDRRFYPILRRKELNKTISA